MPHKPPASLCGPLAVERLFDPFQHRLASSKIGQGRAPGDDHSALAATGFIDSVLERGAVEA
jgi:hypothetical protein